MTALWLGIGLLLLSVPVALWARWQMRRDAEQWDALQFERAMRRFALAIERTAVAFGEALLPAARQMAAAMQSFGAAIAPVAERLARDLDLPGGGQ